MGSDSGNSRQSRSDSTGFFSVGTPLNAVRAGYIRRPADDLLVEAVSARRYAHVISANRTGKSSLIASAAAHLEHNDTHVAVLDLQQIGTREAGSDAGRWFYNVAYRLMRQLRIKIDLQEWWQDKSILSNRQRLLEFYTEIVLGKIDGPIVVFVDGVQVVRDLPFGDQLLASVRAAHNARSADPEFMRLTFVLTGECDPSSLVDEPDLSPFNITQSIPLDDFSRSDIDLYGPELDIEAGRVEQVLDRIYYWTRGHPYLTQKLSRAVSRADVDDDPDEFVDRLVMQQLASRAAINSEPHMSQIHQYIVGDKASREALLNLYGRIRKGVPVATDLGSPLQRELIAVGLLELDEAGTLRVRNRLYETVFTARWANENLPTHWRGPAIAAAVILVMLIVPFWYTQWLPSPYVRVLTSVETSPIDAEVAWLNFRSFPGHSDSADSVFGQYLKARAEDASTEAEIRQLARLASNMASEPQLPQRLIAEYWDRRSLEAMRNENRLDGLLSTIRSFDLSTRLRRSRAAMLASADLPLLSATLSRESELSPGDLRFDAQNELVSLIDGASVTQWSADARGMEPKPAWDMLALEVTPLVRRVVVDAPGTVRRIGLTLSISHPRIQDLVIKLIAPSGKTAEVQLDVERATVNDTLRVPSAQLSELVGEDLSGTWSVSIRDKSLGLAGYLVGWNLNLNAQVLVEDFQRGPNIPDPAEVEPSSVWIGDDARYAVARTDRSDTVRIWDLAYAKPLGAVTLASNEGVIGVDATGQELVTATQQSVHVWDIGTGRNVRTLNIDAGAFAIRFLQDSRRLVTRLLGDIETRFELWSLDEQSPIGSLTVAGSPNLDAVSANGEVLAIADAERSVRIWNLSGAERLAQFDLPYQPVSIELSGDGQHLGVVYPGAGVAQYSVAMPDSPVFEDFGAGDWRFVFSPSGEFTASGHGRTGYQVRDTLDGALVGPLLGEHAASSAGFIAFSGNEQALITPSDDDGFRIWKKPPRAERTRVDGQSVWAPALDSPVVVAPDASKVVTANRSGHVHIVATDVSLSALADAAEDVSYIGHQGAVRFLAISNRTGLVASAGDDGKLRFWHLESGLPTSEVLEISAGNITKMAFSDTGNQLAVLAGNRLLLVDVLAATIAHEIDFLETQSGLVFVDDQKLFVSSSSGNLQSLTRNDSGQWSKVQVWEGDTAVTHLALSPDSRMLVMADAGSHVQQINLEAGQLKPKSVALPSRILDVSFSPIGSRVLVRTERWMHELSASPSGLIWSDAIYLPRVAGDANIAFRRSDPGSFYLPVVIEGRIRLEQFKFSDRDGEGLFGSQAELLELWTSRLASGNTEAAL